jgi:hypothetical protein
VVAAAVVVVLAGRVLGVTAVDDVDELELVEVVELVEPVEPVEPVEVVELVEPVEVVELVEPVELVDVEVAVVEAVDVDLEDAGADVVVECDVGEVEVVELGTVVVPGAGVVCLATGAGVPDVLLAGLKTT